MPKKGAIAESLIIVFGIIIAAVVISEFIKAQDGELPIPLSSPSISPTQTPSPTISPSITPTPTPVLTPTPSLIPSQDWIGPMNLIYLWSPEMYVIDAPFTNRLSEPIQFRIRTKVFNGDSGLLLRNQTRLDTYILLPGETKTFWVLKHKDERISLLGMTSLKVEVDLISTKDSSILASELEVLRWIPRE